MLNDDELKNLSPAERNRAMNFPQYESAITLDQTESVFGPNYAKIMQTVSTMPDTFGLCAVLAVHANGLLTNFEEWKDVNYDPRELKQMFDEKMAEGEGSAAWKWFNEKYKEKFSKGPSDNSVTNEQEWQNMCSSLDDNDGMDIAVICEYPEHRGIHTHWLSARKQPNSDQLLITGDLTPFGINDTAITVPENIIVNSIANVIGKRPTTTNATKLTEAAQHGRQLMENGFFTSNVIVRKY